MTYLSSNVIYVDIFILQNNFLVEFLLDLIWIDTYTKKIAITETDIGSVVVILHFRCELKSVWSHDVLIVD